MCELLPRCISKPEHRTLYDSRDVFIDEDRIAALRQGDIQLKKARKDKSKGPWAAGTGFGSGHTDSDKDAEVWDARKSKAAQRARDLEMERVLIDLSNSLAAELMTCSAKSNEVRTLESLGISLDSNDNDILYDACLTTKNMSFMECAPNFFIGVLCFCLSALVFQHQCLLVICSFC